MTQYIDWTHRKSDKCLLKHMIEFANAPHTNDTNKRTQKTTVIKVRDRMQNNYNYILSKPSAKKAWFRQTVSIKGENHFASLRITCHRRCSKKVYLGKMINDCMTESQQTGTGFSKRKLSLKMLTTLWILRCEKRDKFKVLEKSRLDLWWRSERMVSMVLPICSWSSRHSDRQKRPHCGWVSDDKMAKYH